jgi:hypothetical protein
LRHGHEVLVAGPQSLAGAVESAGYEFWRFDGPPEDELAEVWGRVPSMSPDEQNVVVIGEIFGRLRRHREPAAPRQGVRAVEAGCGRARAQRVRIGGCG